MMRANNCTLLITTIQVRDQNPAVEQMLLMQFDKSRMGGIIPIPPRQRALEVRQKQGQQLGPADTSWGRKGMHGVTDAAAEV